VDEPTFPANDFFTARRELPCRLRHGSALFNDDAKMSDIGSLLVTEAVSETTDLYREI
jgi:hypothetical protein